MPRPILFALYLFVTAGCIAQTRQHTLSDWNNVRLPVGELIRVQDLSGAKRSCVFETYTPDAITCYHTFNAFRPVTFSFTFQRTNVAKVWRETKADSRGLGLLIGGGTGAAIGAGVASTNRDAAALVMGMLGAGFGFSAGQQLMHTHRHLIYQR